MEEISPPAVVLKQQYCTEKTFIFLWSLPERWLLVGLLTVFTGNSGRTAGNSFKKALNTGVNILEPLTLQTYLLP